MGKYKKLVIGVDQSYTRTGISVAADGKLLLVNSISFKGHESSSSKRKLLSKVIDRLIVKYSKRALQTIILCERIRTFSSFGNSKSKGAFSGLQPTYLIKTGALIATIVDTAYEHGIQVYSVDTRAWKSKVVGSAKARKDKQGNRDAKSETVEFVQKLGFDLFLREKTRGKNKGEKVYNDDAADAACIALYGFIPKGQQNLKLEE